MKSVGLDLSGRVIRAVVGTNRRGRLTGIEAAGLPLLETDPTTVADAIAGFLATSGKGARQVVLGFPLRDCTVKVTSFPATTEENLARLAQAEASSQLPLPTGEIDYSHAVIDPGRAGGEATVAIAAGRKAVIAPLLDALAALDVQVAVVDVTPLALVNALAPELGAHGEATALLQAGGAGAELVLLDEAGRVRQVQGIPGDDEGALVEDLRRTLQAWAGGSGSAVRRMVVAGAGAEDLAGALRRTLGLEVTTADPWGGAGPAGLSPAEFAVATGLALRGGPTPLRLNLRERIQTARRAERRQSSVAAAVLAAVFLLLCAAVGGFYTSWRAQGVSLTALQSERDELTKKLDDLGSETPEFLEHLTATKQVVRANSDWLSFLRDLSEQLPGGVAIEEITLERTRPVVIRGEAYTNAAVAQAVDALVGMKRFARVDLDSSNAERIGDELVYHYQIRCYWPEEKPRGGRS